MIALSSIPQHTSYAIPERALSRWVKERLRREPRADGGCVYALKLSGSTCTNVPLEVVMTVSVDAGGTIESATSRPVRADVGCDVMCAAEGSGVRLLSQVGGCEEAVGLTLRDAAFRDWMAEPSGCFCTAGNRRHKWRNVFQAVYFAATHEL